MLKAITPPREPTPASLKDTHFSVNVVTREDGSNVRSITLSGTINSWLTGEAEREELAAVLADIVARVDRYILYSAQAAAQAADAAIDEADPDATP